jgi:uncharacterized protein YciI
MTRVLASLLLAFAAFAAHAQPAEANRLFAVEVKTGPRWDSAKPPADQPFFREHSANLNQLREAGHILMGARYSDKGFLVFSAASAGAVRALMDQDPSVGHGTFTYEVHDFHVFYPGTIPARRRP